MLARREAARRLHVLKVDSVAKQVLIVRRGPALKGDGTSDTVTRWWLESWARCDWSVLPGMRALDVGGPLDGAWGSKGRVPVEYVGHPASELRDEWFDRDFVEHVTVPLDAVDSGYGRDGEHLWFSADAEAWPRARSPIRCA